MKNINIFPFERNHYYYGKLLSVDDFEMEQQYVNNKRRMSNQFLHGNGVIAGLHVIKVDEETVALDKGAAIDTLGREMVVEEAISQKIADIQGFEECTERIGDFGSMYLCMAYDETEQDLVHNMAGSGKEKQHNKYRESFRLYLSGNEPENHQISPSALLEDKKVIYSQKGIRICHCIPRFIGAGENFEMKVEIENLGQQRDFTFSYDLDLTYVKHKGQLTATISFNEKLYAKAGKYCMAVPLTALDVTGVEGMVSVRENSFQLYLDRLEVKDSASGSVKTGITGESVKQTYIQSYYQNQMVYLDELSRHRCIYLAKIVFIKAGTSFVIHQVEAMPFKQYLWNDCLSYMLGQLLISDIDRLKETEQNRLSQSSVPGNTAEQQNILQPNWTTGTVDVKIGKNKRRGHKAFSEEIPHGLGIGHAQIVLGINGDGEEVLFGAGDVFSQNASELRLAAKLNPEKGTFVIGVRLLDHYPSESCTVRWMAFQDQSDVRKSSGKQMAVRPDMIHIGCRESYCLEAVCYNMNDKRIKWSVEKYCGIVDKNGVYTAPDKPGVYEVTAESMVYADVKASAFVVVKDGKRNDD